MGAAATARTSGETLSFAENLRTGAYLFAAGIIKPDMTGEKVFEAVAEQQVRDQLRLDADADVRVEHLEQFDRCYARVKKMFTRERGASTAQRYFFEMVLAASLSAQPRVPEPLGVLSEAQVNELIGALTKQDPALVPAHRALERALATSVPQVRLALCLQAADHLDAVTPQEDPDRSEASAQPRRVQLEHIGGLWARLFEVAVGESGRIDAVQVALAERAVCAGYRCQQRARQLQTRLIFGQRMSETPSHVALYGAGRAGRWLAAGAAVHALQNSSPEQVVTRTVALAASAGADPDALSPAAILTQAGWTLLNAGRRHLADRTVQAAWDSPGGTPDELLQLSVELAGHQYAHGERAAAERTLGPRVQAILASDPGGDPEGAGWGEVVSYTFYAQLLTALHDPYAAVGRMRAQWVQSLTDSVSTAYPDKWILAGVLVELLSVCGEPGAAATVAQTSRRALWAPRTTAQEQLRAHLSEMSAGDSPVSPDQADRALALLEQLTVLLVDAPQALDWHGRLSLEGLSRMLGSTDPRRQRIRPAI